MNEIDSLRRRREELLDNIQAIDAMLRGKITTSCPQRTHRDGSTYQAGPYYKLQRWQEGNNATQYVSAEEYPVLKEYVDNYQAYKTLCDELAEVTEALTALRDQEGLVGRVARPRKKKSSKASRPKRSTSSSTSRARRSTRKAP